MNECECSECGVSASGHVWGFALLAQRGWTVARGERHSAARSWLCADCAQRAEQLARGMIRLTARKRARGPSSKRYSAHPAPASGSYKVRHQSAAHEPRVPADDIDLPALVQHRR